MISAEAIQRLATQYQTTTLNVAREYCQHLFLSAFYQHKTSSRILFKGGTALRVIYGSPRFSEDLDFSGFSLRAPAIETLLEETLGVVERVGIGVEIEEAKATSGGYLGIIHHRFLDYRVETRLEISLRGRTVVRPETTLIAGDFLPAYTLLHLPQERLVEEKLDALLDRAKPRDFYDLYFLLRKGLVPRQHRHRLAEILTRLTRMSSESFQEMKLFLPRDHQTIAKDLKSVLARELQRYV
ncbi:MAG: nucleotidyl transferase AbiEii/AbiGii toxin family protein [Candidatus Omnitrophica bacterium]|nr:nucleotidyl transferase AbiEii/AbiGii toxin family protein [Candidatus Omnitrophota bacterium]